MIFVLTYQSEIEAVFFHIWDAQQYINFFNKEEQEQMEILRIDTKELRNLKNILEKAKKVETNNHCCGNCARTFWDKRIFLCDFTKEEVNPNDYCIHYI